MNSDFAKAITRTGVVNQFNARGIFREIDADAGKLKITIEIAVNSRQIAKACFERFVVSVIEAVAYFDTWVTVNGLKQFVIGTFAIYHYTNFTDAHWL